MVLPSRFGMLLALPLALASCAYASDYVVPNDDRARVLWRDGEPRAVVPARSGTCELATREASQNYAPPDSVRRCAEDGSCGQVRVDPWIFIDGVPHAHPPLFGLHASDVAVAPISPPAPAGGGVPLHPGDPVPSPGGTHHAMPAPPKGGGSSSGSSSMGSLGDMKELAVVVAVLAILTMPAVAIALASSRPESETGAAHAVDQVNAYNDLARSPGSACSPIPANAPYLVPVQDSPAAAVPDALPPLPPPGIPAPPPAPEGQR
ncbi:MAG TPA: hypothetical protein VGK67_30965 [Myxococcales bacterium]|jgi:hypothetical protein